MKNRKLFLEALVRESVRMLVEQDVSQAGSAVPPSPVPPAPATNPPAPTPAPTAPPSPVPSPEGQAKPLDVDTLISRMNVVRGGRSFADPEVYGNLTTYFKSMSESDKGVVDKFLQEIGKIVIQVEEPSGQNGGVQPPMQQAPIASAPAPAAPTGAV